MEQGTAPAGGSEAAGGAASQPAAGPREGESLADFGVRHNREMFAEAERIAAGDQPTDPNNPNAPKPGQPDPAQDPAQQPGQEVLQEFGFGQLQLPPEAREHLVGKLTEWRDWHAQMSQFHEAVQDEARRLDAIASDPRFQQAMQMVMRGGQAGAAGNGHHGRGQNGAGQPGQPGLDAPPQFETETERRLWEDGQNLRNELQDHRRAVAELNAWRQGQEKDARRQTLGSMRQQIAAAHEQLDKKYPEIAKPELRKQWHEMATGFLLGAIQNGQQMDVPAALERAAKALHYDHATAAGKRSALTAAKSAARSSTMREGDNKATPALPENVGFAEFARNMHGLQPAGARG